MGKRSIRRYESTKQMLRTREVACGLAVDAIQHMDYSSGKLMALCIFFETYITKGASKTESVMKLMSAEIDDEGGKPAPGAVVQLITRDS